MAVIKKNNAVVFGLTVDHVFAVACVMMDLKSLSVDMFDEVVIFHDGIKEKDMHILQSILPTRFIRYDFPLSARVLDSRSVQQFTKMVFTKFECLRLLDEYKNVMWLDYDMVIQQDISNLFSPCVSGIKMMPGGMPVRDQLLEAVSEYDMNAEGICACIFVFQETLLNYKECYRFCYEKLEEYVEVLYMPEQAIFDFMIQAYSLNPLAIDSHIYSPHPSDLQHATQAKIIHSYGQPKFWNGLYNKQWEKNYDEWLKLGGSKYRFPGIIDKLNRKFKNIGRRLKLILNGVYK